MVLTSGPDDGRRPQWSAAAAAEGLGLCLDDADGTGRGNTTASGRSGLSAVPVFLVVMLRAPPLPTRRVRFPAGVNLGGALEAGLAGSAAANGLWPEAAAATAAALLAAAVAAPSRFLVVSIRSPLVVFVMVTPPPAVVFTSSLPCLRFLILLILLLASPPVLAICPSTSLASPMFLLFLASRMDLTSPRGRGGTAERGGGAIEEIDSLESTPASETLITATARRLNC